MMCRSFHALNVENAMRLSFEMQLWAPIFPLLNCSAYVKHCHICIISDLLSMAGVFETERCIFVEAAHSRAL